MMHNSQSSGKGRGATPHTSQVKPALDKHAIPLYPGYDEAPVQVIQMMNSREPSTQGFVSREKFGEGLLKNTLAKYSC